MIEVGGLPIQITKADLDELFSAYGTIQSTEKSVVIKIDNEGSTAYVELDKAEGENLAIKVLNESLFRNNFILTLKGRPLGDGVIPGFPEASNVGPQDDNNSEKKN